MCGIGGIRLGPGRVKMEERGAACIHADPGLKRWNLSVFRDCMRARAADTILGTGVSSHAWHWRRKRELYI